eukprot:9340912-Pyramimonas_sp.AAC.1
MHANFKLVKGPSRRRNFQVKHYAMTLSPLLTHGALEAQQPLEELPPSEPPPIPMPPRQAIPLVSQAWTPNSTKALQDLTQAQVAHAVSTFQALANIMLNDSRESFRQHFAQQVQATERRVDTLNDVVSRT